MSIKYIVSYYDDATDDQRVTLCSSKDEVREFIVDNISKFADFDDFDDFVTEEQILDYFTKELSLVKIIDWPPCPSKNTDKLIKKAAADLKKIAAKEFEGIQEYNKRNEQAREAAEKLKFDNAKIVYLALKDKYEG